MAFPYAASVSSVRPEKALEIKCTFDRSKKKIVFTNARNCSYDLLRRRVEQCFALRASSLYDSAKDDDGEICPISCDNDLTEAVHYFNSGGDDTRPISSGSSILSGRSGSSRARILIMLDVTVDYDGPSLSDAGSSIDDEDFDLDLDDLEEDSDLLYNQLKGVARYEIEDDAKTVSSHDTGSKPASSMAWSTPRRPPMSRIPSALPEDSAESEADEAEPKPGTSRVASSAVGSSSYKPRRSPVPPERSLRSVPSVPSVELRYPDDPDAVFERLKIREAEESLTTGSSDSLPEQSSFANSERNRLWLQQQEMLNPMALMKHGYPGIRKSPSSSVLSDRKDDMIPGKLALQQDPSGKYYYSYTSDDAPRPTHDNVIADLSHVHHLSQSIDDSLSKYLKSDTASSRPVSFEVYSEAGPSSRPVSLAITTSSHHQHHHHVRPLSLATHSSNGVALHGYEHDHLNIHPEIPAEVLAFLEPGLARPPERVTDCSSCGLVLDSFRYVCTTCGERPAHASNPFADPGTPDGKGKGPASAPSEYSALYPPSAHRSPSAMSSSVTLLDPVPSPRSNKPLPRVPPIGGFELCPVCMETTGVKHAIESDSYGTPSSPMPPSPHSPGAARRPRAPARHAFVEKVWGVTGWTDVEQDHDVFRCSICSTTLAEQRFKCASCTKFDLCHACYSQVHEIHPSHAFLVVADKPEPMPPMQRETEPIPALALPPNGEESMQHDGVKCAHCMQDIVGARFRCAICDNIDICANCESAGLPGNLTSPDGGHDYSHIMIKIPYPIADKEVQGAARRALTLWTGRDARQLRRSTRRSGSPRSERSVARTVMRHREHRAQGHVSAPVPPHVSAPPSVAPRHSLRDPEHRTKCKGCHSNIVGVRYQCATCPSSHAPYSLCAACEPRSYLLHDPMHIFFKIPRPLVRPIKSPFPFLPILYRTPAGTFPDGTRNVTNPREYLTQLYHPTALCDWCVTLIRGEWYRCAYCGKDLCAACEEIDTHDPTHLFVVFKSSVDMSQLSRFSDLEEPQPFIPYPVY